MNVTAWLPWGNKRRIEFKARLLDIRQINLRVGFVK
jgi:hypothetical protein